MKQGKLRYGSWKLFVHFASEEICLLHDSEKFFFINFTIAISICLIDHFLQFLVCHALANLLSNALQVLETDFASLIIVEEAEGFQDLVFRISVQDLMCHHLEEFFVLDGA